MEGCFLRTRKEIVRDISDLIDAKCRTDCDISDDNWDKNHHKQAYCLNTCRVGAQLKKLGDELTEVTKARRAAQKKGVI